MIGHCASEFRTNPLRCLGGSRPGKGLTLVALGNTDGLNWPNWLQVAEVEKNPLALKFLELFAAD